MRKIHWPMVALLTVAAWLGPRHVPAHAQPRPAADELAMSIRDGFTMASVGDLIVAYPQSDNPDPQFQGVLKLIRDADVATGNYEGNIIDGRRFRGSGPGGFGGVPEVAPDVKAMGFRLVARSNNHMGEYGYEGLLETNKHLEDAGVVYAGSGETYAAAYAPRYVTTAKGRVGMVATAGSFALQAEPARGEWPGRGGQSGLRTTRVFVSPPSLWESVKNIRQAFPNGTGFYAPGFTDTDMTLLGQRFKLDKNTTIPHYAYDMNQQDLREILAMVREGKTRSDFMTLAIHSHHFHDTAGGERGLNVPENESIDTNPSIADYLPVLAKAAIDAGADAFLGTGVHVLRGIEIYKGRPIFYGLGEFFRQMDIIGLSGMGGGRGGEAAAGAGGGESDPPIKYESVLAVSRFERGQLVELRLHPVELTDRGVRLVHRGIPRLASPEASRRILARLQKLSAPLGTTIAIEGNIGVIRLRPSTSQ
jgi:poly-gamma-glutamate capsule biosynthesis protein CapA/YwtB (metallophosphatase superfamily)